MEGVVPTAFYRWMHFVHLTAAAIWLGAAVASVVMATSGSRLLSMVVAGDRREVVLAQPMTSMAT